MKITQHGDYTVYQFEDGEGSDVILRSHPTPTGADVIHLASSFIDEGKFLSVQTITEEEFIRLQSLGTNAQRVKLFFDDHYRSE